MIASADRWGPFADNLDAAEYRARLRALRALARAHVGPRAAPLCQYLAQAETSPAALEPALDALGRLGALDRRRLLAAYVHLSAA
ncbi:hypothetical protein [Methylobacterium thuringiense]|uniref:Uncharacterized protein n=1 Tax=Methylobacterium thuringiense TaxID=1003091 RepID=A0ABQ4TPS0_9HYPH|nr:hypothetical protein [Methylobacterium thuringiense]GJE57301.1 hypothetical protein EKPJFOCH_3815 [Methylobacterium thuringiense]